MSRFRIIVCAITLALGMGTAGLFAAAGASAAPAPGSPVLHSPTIACQAGTGGMCEEIGFGQAIPASLAKIPADDVAQSVGPRGIIVTNLNNNTQLGDEDFNLDGDGFVPHPGQPDGAYPFTARDKVLYGGDPVVNVEWIPLSFDTVACVQNIVNPVTHVGRLALRSCDGGRDQAFIITRTAPGDTTTPLPYFRVLSVLPTVSRAGHGCVTATNYLTGAQVTVNTCRNTPPAQVGAQDLTLIP